LNGPRTDKIAHYRAIFGHLKPYKAHDLTVFRAFLVCFRHVERQISPFVLFRKRYRLIVVKVE